LLFSKLLQERLPGATVEFVGESVLRILNTDRKESTAYLDNLWLKYENGSEDRPKLIEKYLRMIESLPAPDKAVLRQDIVAQIKDSLYMEVARQGPRKMTEYLCGDLWIVYGVDQPDSITTLGYDAMQAAGVSETELRGLAVRNLERILPKIERHGGGPWYLLTAGADYVASLLLFDGMWEQLAEDVEGKIVATVPTRDVLMYTGSRSRDGLSAIKERSAQIEASGTHAISSSLIMREGGKWTVFNAN
jgi:uncharacterized protein YtpQ (UPF0354 family)